MKTKHKRKKTGWQRQGFLYGKKFHTDKEDAMIYATLEIDSVKCRTKQIISKKS
jgi:hypothetical protein